MSLLQDFVPNVKDYKNSNSFGYKLTYFCLAKDPTHIPCFGNKISKDIGLIRSKIC